MNQESGGGTQETVVWRAVGVMPVAYASGSLTRIVSRAMFWFISLAILLVPIFAHGCHGDDVDHEPLLIPIRLDPENR